MADAVSVSTILNDPNRIVVRCLNRSDGTGEVDAIKIDKSALAGLLGYEPATLEFEWAQWSIQGFSSIMMEWDRGTDIVIAHLAAGNGYRDNFAGGINDSGSAGTGDVVITTFGAVANATYDIEMSFKKCGSVVV